MFRQRSKLESYDMEALPALQATIASFKKIISVEGPGGIGGIHVNIIFILLLILLINGLALFDRFFTTARQEKLSQVKFGIAQMIDIFVLLLKLNPFLRFQNKKWLVLINYLPTSLYMYSFYSFVYGFV